MTGLKGSGDKVTQLDIFGPNQGMMRNVEEQERRLLKGLN